jgi:hypothetical protein
MKCHHKLRLQFLDGPFPRGRSIYKQVSRFWATYYVLDSKRSCRKYVLRRNCMKLVLHYKQFQENHWHNVHSKLECLPVAWDTTKVLFHSCETATFHRLFDTSWTKMNFVNWHLQGALCWRNDPRFLLAVVFDVVCVDTWTVRIRDGEPHKIPQFVIVPLCGPVHLLWVQLVLLWPFFF